MVLRAAWNFNESSGPTSLDRSGNEFTAALAPTAIRADGALGTSAGGDRSLTAVGGRLATASGGVILAASTNALTITSHVWYPTRDLGVELNLITAFQAGGTEVCGVYLTGSGQVGCFQFGTGGFDVFNTNDRPTDGAWNHLAYVWSGGTMRLYINGVIKDETRTVTGTLPAAVNYIDLGAVDAWEQGNTLERRLDNVRVYDHALTGAEVLADMNTPLPNDPGGDPTFSGTLPLAATGTLARTGSVTHRATLARTASGTLARTGSVTHGSTLARTATGTLGRSGAPTHGVNQWLTGAGAVGTSGAPAFGAGLGMGGTGGLGGDGAPGMASPLGLAGEGVLLLTPTGTPMGDLDLSALATLTLGGVPAFGATLVLSGGGSLTVDGAPVHRAVVALTATGTLSRAGGQVLGGVLALSGDGTLGLAGLVPGDGTATILVDGVEKAMTVTLWVGGREVPVTVEGVWVDGGVRPLV